ncbi:hypothetical protein ACFL96_11530 [Thermoproteota archaeon]
MPKTLAEKLKEKGWTDEEISKTLDIVYSEEKREKHIEYKKEMNQVVYWTTLLVLTIGNFLVSILLIPFLIAMQPYQLVIIVAVLGLVIGLLFDFIIKDIEHIERQHHVIAAIFIPALALINIFVMLSIAKSISLRLGLEMYESPILIAVVYVVAFLIPYTVTQVREFRRM